MKDAGAAIVEDLNRLMAEEVEAFLRYFQIRFRLRGRGRQAAEKFFEDALRETLDHAEALAKEIQGLGQIPRLHIHLVLSDRPTSADEALAEALDVEQQALDAYKDCLLRVSGDPKLEAFIRKQIEIETEHVQEIRDVVQTEPGLKLVERPTSES